MFEQPRSENNFKGCNLNIFYNSWGFDFIFSMDLNVTQKHIYKTKSLIEYWCIAYADFELASKSAYCMENIHDICYNCMSCCIHLDSVFSLRYYVVQVQEAVCTWMSSYKIKRICIWMSLYKIEKNESKIFACRQTSKIDMFYFV